MKIYSNKNHKYECSLLLKEVGSYKWKDSNLMFFISLNQTLNVVERYRFFYLHFLFISYAWFFSLKSSRVVDRYFSSVITHNRKGMVYYTIFLSPGNKVIFNKGRHLLSRANSKYKKHIHLILLKASWLWPVRLKCHLCGFAIVLWTSWCIEVSIILQSTINKIFPPSSCCIQNAISWLFPWRDNSLTVPSRSTNVALISLPKLQLKKSVFVFLLWT